MIKEGKKLIVKKTYPECVFFTCDSCNKNCVCYDAIEVSSCPKIIQVVDGFKRTLQQRKFTGTCVECYYSDSD